MADEQSNLTFEAIDAHVQANLHRVTAEAAAAAPGDVLGRVCQIYHVIRPILQGILLIPFIPAAWKTAIKAFITLMDSLCQNR